MAGLGLEAMFYHFRKVPFACTYLPGKIKFHTWGVPFAIACLFFFSITAVIERALLRAPAKFGIFYAATAVIWLTLRAGNRRFYRRASLIFEEQPAPALVTFPEAP
jgi:hypothetical protein